MCVAHCRMESTRGVCCYLNEQNVLTAALLVTAHRMVGNWKWCDMTHNTFSWGALSCQAWVVIICHPVVEISNVAYSAKYGCIRPGDLIVIRSHCNTSQQHVLVLNHCFCPMKYDRSGAESCPGILGWCIWQQNDKNEIDIVLTFFLIVFCLCLPLDLHH